ncbi:hypothetical protein, partial [Kytococcus sp. HMSC28H12]|uniref:hypothetical protein n=1 Tax=Kytococcus sp. HMSC28H12 TaxID=1581067 RepID=UPI00143A7A04
WSVPAVAVAASAPAVAASKFTCPTNPAGIVDGVFTTYKAGMPDLSNVDLNIWYVSGGGEQNGALSSAGVNMRNLGTQDLDWAGYNLLWEIGVRQVDTSPAVNTLDQVRYTNASQYTKLVDPWSPDGDNSGDTSRAREVDSCVTRRDFNISSSYGTFYNTATGAKLGTAAISEDQGTCQGTYYNYLFEQTGGDSALDTFQLVAFQMRDGSHNRGTIYTTIGVKPVGFAAPSWTWVLAELKKRYPTATEADLTTCFQGAYNARVKLWNTDPADYAAGMKYSYEGWAAPYYDTRRAATNNAIVWANEIGNYLSYAPEGTGNINANVPQLRKGAEGVNQVTYWNRTMADGLAPLYALEQRDGIW